jgi:hypothetical protein
VKSGINGIILEEPTATCITGALRDCIANPDRLQKFAAASRLVDEFTIETLAHRLQEVGTTLYER